MSRRKACFTVTCTHCEADMTVTRRPRNGEQHYCDQTACQAARNEAVRVYEKALRQRRSKRTDRTREAYGDYGQLVALMGRGGK